MASSKLAELQSEVDDGLVTFKDFDDVKKRKHPYDVLVQLARGGGDDIVTGFYGCQTCKAIVAKEAIHQRINANGTFKCLICNVCITCFFQFFFLIVYLLFIFPSLQGRRSNLSWSDGVDIHH